MSKSPEGFQAYSLKPALQKALAQIGYELPSPIQQQSIPALLDGHDLIAQAQTGTGKTAAFSLPILHKLNLKRNEPQALILTPTRELAIQVAETIQSYAKYLNNFHIVPVYGGQDFQVQLRALKRGPQIIVGTPGRIMDHIRRGTLKLDTVLCSVLDEADEMLRMGFIEDVQWILEHIPHEHQAALFSATMPSSIKKIARTYLTDAVEIKVKSKSMTAANIDQNAMLVNQKNKFEALTGYLEIENIDSALIFARTKNMTAELADKLSARGYLAAALNGDMNQNAREKVVNRLKKNALDLVIATDVAARGLDVERISHVVNYDAPYDAETYTHRIGRTGRAGRHGKSLLILTQREHHFIRDIEKSTNQKITIIEPPSAKQLADNRLQHFVEQITKIISRSSSLEDYRQLVKKIVANTKSNQLDVAAALLKIAQRDKPLNSQDSDFDSSKPTTKKLTKNKPRKNGSKKSSKSKSKSKHRQKKTKSSFLTKPKRRRRK